jgi:serine/threonine protein kinase
MKELKLLQCRVDGRYDLEDCLGRGSYAEIYVARDRGAADEQFRRVVIKALNVLLQGYQDLELERTLVQNFQNEAIALDRVRHPNVISRLGHGTAIDLNGVAFHYLVLEYLGGGDMAAFYRQEPLKVNRALFYLQQVCAGLAHAHQSGVIHRDIKPQNLLLTADQQTVKIADFGVAKLEAGDGAITRVGTNIYAAPEHNPLVQTGSLDTASPPIVQTQLTPAADVYSLAKTAYALICGAPPRNFAQRAITELPPAICSEFWARPVLDVLERATQTRATERYQTVAEFWKELNDAALPQTRLLVAGDVGPRLRSDLSLDTAVVVEAPPRPQFETARELQREQFAGDTAARPRIVVPVTGPTPQPLNTYATTDHTGRLTVALPRNGKPAPLVALSPGSAKPKHRVRRLVVSAILVLTFAGLLLATGAYVRSRVNRQTAPPATPTLAGREGVTTTDLNLRADPSTSSDPIGLAESGSRVKVLSVNNNWCEVQVEQHNRAKVDPNSADHGWVNKRFLKFE